MVRIGPFTFADDLLGFFGITLLPPPPTTGAPDRRALVTSGLSQPPFSLAQGRRHRLEPHPTVGPGLEPVPVVDVHPVVEGRVQGGEGDV